MLRAFPVRRAVAAIDLLQIRGAERGEHAALLDPDADLGGDLQLQRAETHLDGSRRVAVPLAREIQHDISHPALEVEAVEPGVSEMLGHDLGRPRLDDQLGHAHRVRVVERQLRLARGGGELEAGEGHPAQGDLGRGGTGGQLEVDGQSAAQLQLESAGRLVEILQVIEVQGELGIDVEVARCQRADPIPIIIQRRQPHPKLPPSLVEAPLPDGLEPLRVVPHADVVEQIAFRRLHREAADPVYHLEGERLRNRVGLPGRPELRPLLARQALRAEPDQGEESEAAHRRAHAAFVGEATCA